MAERGKPVPVLIITQQEIDTFPACSVKSINFLIRRFCQPMKSRTARSRLSALYVPLDSLHLAERQEMKACVRSFIHFRVERVYQYPFRTFIHTLHPCFAYHGKRRGQASILNQQ